MIFVTACVVLLCDALCKYSNKLRSHSEENCIELEEFWDLCDQNINSHYTLRFTTPVTDNEIQYICALKYFVICL
jgi:hypothetical protein